MLFIKTLSTFSNVNTVTFAQNLFLLLLLLLSLFLLFVLKMDGFMV